MIDAAFLVEGDLEKIFVQNVCPGSPVRKINCNGDSVSIEAIATRIGTLGRLLQRRCRTLVIVFDRERRAESCEQIEAALRRAMAAENLNTEIVVGIPDRDIEVWILGDPDMLRAGARLRADVCLACEDGVKGKSKLKSLLAEGIHYVETVHGPEWLKKARPSVICQNSASFARFKDAMRAFDCWWLKQSSLL